MSSSILFSLIKCSFFLRSHHFHKNSSIFIKKIKSQCLHKKLSYARSGYIISHFNFYHATLRGCVNAKYGDLQHEITIIDYLSRSLTKMIIFSRIKFIWMTYSQKLQAQERNFKVYKFKISVKFLFLICSIKPLTPNEGIRVFSFQ